MKNIQISDFKHYRFIDSLKLSPNGKNTALLGRKANDDNDYDIAIFIDKGQGFKPLTNSKGKIAQFIWKDNDTILFSEVRDKKDKEKIEKGHELTCFYTINIHGGEAELAFKVDATVTKLEQLTADKYIATTIYNNARPSLQGKTEAEIQEILKEQEKAKSYQVIDELPYWFNGKGFTNKKRTRLNILTSTGLKPITHELANVSDYKLSPCKKYLAYTGDPAPAEIHSMETNIYILDLETLEEKKALQEPKRVRAFDYWNSKLLVSFSEPGQPLHTHGHFYIVDPATKEAVKLAEHDSTIGQPGNSDSKFGGGITSKVEGDYYYFTSISGYKTDILALDLNTGAIQNTTNSGGNIDFFDIQGARTVMGFMQPGKLMEVYESIGGNLTKISAFNDEFHKTHMYSTPEYFTFENTDGVEIDGWVIKPVNYEPGKKYPAVLQIHGGPKTAYTESYFHEMQVFASNGYFVMYSNPRGSDGKGNQFADIRGKYGTIDYDDLMQFVDACQARYPGIDDDNMGVLGGSYGGFMTNWIVGHTHRFNAAVSMRSISNWMPFTFISDIGYYFGKDQMGVDDVWEEAEKLWWHSPLKYAKNVKTPTLLLHSDADYRCWVPEAYQFYTALKLLGVDTRLVVFHGENHELSRSGKPELRIKRLTEIIQWMDRYLKP
ncbi:MAG: S9 family peptidase [Defluviitaleaceae bacterium]|nr:S9 family peptidase [Defluviitaleaceae bacterium]